MSTSPKGRLALTALREFGRRRFDHVTVSELSAGAGVTTGALYHHFESKLGLYTFVRADVERRLLDRVEGALAAAHAMGGVNTALLVGFDFAVQQRLWHLLAAPPPEGETDLLAETIAAAVSPPLVGRLLVAAWRAALTAVADGADPVDARLALQTVLSAS